MAAAMAMLLARACAVVGEWEMMERESSARERFPAKKSLGKI